MKMGRTWGVALFTAFLVAVIICSILITQGYISDTDASTYVIVPMLMLPVFAVFMLKEKDLVPEVGPNSVVLGIILFSLFIVLELDSLGYLGAAFFAYRIDMLLVPIAIAALASLIFGIRNLRRFAWISVYALFASPVLLAPIINLNLGFASANSFAIFQILKPAFAGLSFVNPITIYLNGHGVEIGNTCIGIGAIIGLAMFLLPVAYFMDGRPRSRFLWVLGAVLLMVFLNFLRMLFITLAWFSYGPSSSILDIHSFVGQLIFYAVIIAMLLLHGRFGLEYPKIEIKGSKAAFSSGAVVIAVALSALYLLLSLSYLNAQQATFASVSHNPVFDKSAIVALYGTYIAYNGTTISALGAGNRSVAITLQNAAAGGMPILVIFAGSNADYESAAVLDYSTAWKEYANGGNVGYLYYVPGQSPSVIYRSRVLYSSGGRSYIIDMFVVAPEYNSAGVQSCQSRYDRFYSFFADAVQLDPSTLNSSLDSQYCQLTRILK